MNRTSIRLGFVTAFGAAALTLAPSIAGAHVTIHPNALPAGGFTVISVRVPTEEANASTKKVDVQIPPGILFLSTAAQAGWKAKITYRKLAKPITVFGEERTQEVGRVVWTATGAGIRPGEFLEFPMSLSVPATKGRVLTFKALQTYSSGKIVRWIDAPSVDLPAPQVMIVDKNNPLQDFPGGIASIRLAK